MNAERKMRQTVLLAERILSTYIAGARDSESVLADLIAVFEDEELARAVLHSHTLDVASAALARHTVH
jgi:hypothetical protein